LKIAPDDPQIYFFDPVLGLQHQLSCLSQLELNNVIPSSRIDTLSSIIPMAEECGRYLIGYHAGKQKYGLVCLSKKQLMSVIEESVFFNEVLDVRY
jgi:hypothetical protein